MECTKFPKGPKVSYESAMQGPGYVSPYLVGCKYHAYKWQVNSWGNKKNLEWSVSALIKNLSQVSPWPGQDSNQTPPQCLQFYSLVDLFAESREQ